VGVDLQTVSANAGKQCL